MLNAHKCAAAFAPSDTERMTERLPGPAVRPIAAAAASETYEQQRHLVLDDFLTLPALYGLRQHALATTMWEDNKRGYLGAYPKSGLAVPLLAQVRSSRACAHPTTTAAAADPPLPPSPPGASA